MRDQVNLAPAEEGGFVVTFPDIPEAITQGTIAKTRLKKHRMR